MNFIEKNIAKIITQIIERTRFFLVELIFRGTNNKRIIEVYIDGEKDISAEDCANLSQEINSELENLEELTNDYRLDVSSPGVDKPLKFLKQYPKHIDRKFEVSYKSGDESKQLTGRLLKIEGEVLTFSLGKNEINISFNNIKKAKVIVSFS